MHYILVFCARKPQKNSQAGYGTVAGAVSGAMFGAVSGAVSGAVLDTLIELRTTS